MAGITDKLRTLNDADLSKLAGRVDALRAKLQKDLAANAQGRASGSGQSADELIEALETAKRRGLI